LSTINPLWIGVGPTAILGIAAIVFFSGGYPFLGDEDSIVTICPDTIITTETPTTTINTTTTTTTTKTKPEEVIPTGELKVCFGINFNIVHNSVQAPSDKYCINNCFPSELSFTPKVQSGVS
jgi:hypothetical protein